MPENVGRPGQADGLSRTAGQSRRHAIETTTCAVALQVYKRGRLCTIGKLVVAEPLGELVLAMPYRHRQEVGHVSLPPSVLAYARDRGARLWLVRLDGQGECYALSLEDVEAIGWLQRSDGRPEWFVPLAEFQRIGWQDWAYAERTITVGEEPDPMAGPRQAVQGVLL